MARWQLARPRKSRLILLSLALLLVLGSALSAVVRRYCVEAWIGDCLNTMSCDFFSGSSYVGSIHIDYNCPV